MENNRCSECVLSGVERRCDGVGCVDKIILEKEIELRDAMEKVTNLIKEINELKVRSRKEYDDLMKEIEGEPNESEVHRSLRKKV
jgi:hypothetical protein